ncbi:hypothetical protein BTH41_00838 [Bacillus mycoides]|nr:hypothetical protein BTH41_00838 [Bacillus mycoides]
MKTFALKRYRFRRQKEIIIYISRDFINKEEEKTDENYVF